MSRKFERVLMIIIGSWQLLDALYTIFYYGIIRTQLGRIEEVRGTFLITGIVGTMFIGLALTNYVLQKRFVKDNQVNKKVGIFLIVQAFLSLLLWDIPSLILSITASVILLAKNKSIAFNYSTTN